jgi:predicted secreted protein
MSQAQTSFGVSLLQGVVPVAEITSLTPPSFNSETIDVTNHDSVGRMAEFIGGMRSSDDVKITCNYIVDDPGQVLLLADQADGLVHAFTINFPTAWGASFDFSAVVLKCAVSPFTAKGDAVQLETTLKISGSVTLSTTASAGLTTPFFVLSPAGIDVPVASATPGTYINDQLDEATAVTVTPTADNDGVIEVNGKVVLSGEASGTITLGAKGTVTTITITVKETGKGPKTYTILVARASA